MPGTISSAAVLETATLKFDEVATHAPGPSGFLPITPDMLLNAPSGNLFGLSQNAGMGWEPKKLLGDEVLILSTHGGLRAPDGTPIALGLVPLVFSLALFLLPIGRALLRPLKARQVAREKGRLGVLREVLTRIDARQEVTDAGLERAWVRAAGAKAGSGEISARVAELGADVAVSNGTADKSSGVRYRFADLETEAKALEEEREAAPEEEKKVGKVVFGSDDP